MTEQIKSLTAFPTLTEEQIALLTDRAEAATFAPTEVLFHEGESDFSFFWR